LDFQGAEFVYYHEVAAGGYGGMDCGGGLGQAFV
jgi:hypothetical protein